MVLVPVYVMELVLVNVVDVLLAALQIVLVVEIIVLNHAEQHVEVVLVLVLQLAVVLVQDAEISVRVVGEAAL